MNVKVSTINIDGMKNPEERYLQEIRREKEPDPTGPISESESQTASSLENRKQQKPLFFNKKRTLLQHLFFNLFRSAAMVNALALFIILYFMIANGWRAISIDFLTQPPREMMTQGGILPCIVGTLCLSLGAFLISFPIGVSSAIYLQEYASEGALVRAIRLGISNLAGVPSVVFGLFGLSFFVTYLKMGVSILAGALTLALMSLPVIIGATEEALKSVPATYREASLGLGATKLQTILRVVLPAAAPGILTGGILGISRTAGETAPIMFTAAVFFSPNLPRSIFDEVMALPYHIYVLATAGTEIEVTRPLQYGTALVLIALVLGMNLIAILFRARLRKKMRR